MARPRHWVTQDLVGAGDRYEAFGLIGAQVRVGMMLAREAPAPPHPSGTRASGSARRDPASPAIQRHRVTRARERMTAQCADEPKLRRIQPIRQRRRTDIAQFTSFHSRRRDSKRSRKENRMFNLCQMY